MFKSAPGMARAVKAAPTGGLRPALTALPSPARAAGSLARALFVAFSRRAGLNPVIVPTRLFEPAPIDWGRSFRDDIYRSIDQGAG
jgi:hypothetical protein